MKLLIVIPPLPDKDNEPVYPWYLREENHAGPDSTPMPPHFAPAIASRVRQIFQGRMEVVVKDGLLNSFTVEELQRDVTDMGVDVVFMLMGLDIIEWDSQFAQLSCPVIAQICPVTIDPAEAIELYGFNIPYFIYGGETEQTLANALQELNDNGAICDTPGMVIWSEAGLVRTAFPEVSDMKSYVIPAYDLFPMAAYLDRQSRMEERRGYQNSVLIKTMKGCLFKCIFCTCSTPGQQARYKSAEQVVQEIVYLKENHGVERVVFLDSEFGVNLSRSKQICRKLIEENVKIRYLVNNRIDLVDEELVLLMKASGCELMRYGIESADPDVLARIRKKIDLKKAVKSIQMTRANGIPVNLFFLIGLPGETAKTVELNADFIVKNQADSYSLGRVFLIPGTALYNEIKQEGKLMVSDWQLYRKNEVQQFPHEYYTDMEQLQLAERRLLNRINRSRLSSYRMGRLNERIYLFLSSFGLFSIVIKKRFPCFFSASKRLFQKLLNV